METIRLIQILLLPPVPDLCTAALASVNNTCSANGTPETLSFNLPKYSPAYVIVDGRCDGDAKCPGGKGKYSITIDW